MLRDPELRSMTDWHTLQVLEMKCIGNRRSSLSYQEFINIVSIEINFLKKDIATFLEKRSCCYSKYICGASMTARPGTRSIRTKTLSLK